MVKPSNQESEAKKVGFGLLEIFFWKIKQNIEKSKIENFINTFCFQMSQNSFQTKFLTIFTIWGHYQSKKAKNGIFWPFLVFF